MFERKNGEVSSKLGGQDFTYFERLSAKMQNMAAKQDQSAKPQAESANKDKPTNNGFKKKHAIDID